MFLIPRGEDLQDEVVSNPALVSISADGYLRFWDIAGGHLQHEVTNFM